MSGELDGPSGKDKGVVAPEPEPRTVMVGFGSVVGNLYPPEDGPGPRGRNKWHVIVGVGEDGLLDACAIRTSSRENPDLSEFAGTLPSSHIHQVRAGKWPLKKYLLVWHRGQYLKEYCHRMLQSFTQKKQLREKQFR